PSYNESFVVRSARPKGKKKPLLPAWEEGL
ncbi:unnamed protein product, partial [marine sediment metagenome]